MEIRRVAGIPSTDSEGFPRSPEAEITRRVLDPRYVWIVGVGDSSDWGVFVIYVGVPAETLIGEPLGEVSLARPTPPVERIERFDNPPTTVPAPDVGSVPGVFVGKGTV